ncbi:MAG: translation initiation factor IF-2 [Candidatus Terraquivivens tikiterensis]|uniref:Probable translation initiation factor IF-2 n=1 Tax=Candidatus Terraquivivens tikiterensis TaxID=1980982 RepID=A0A2R7Y8I1_9ARCH|nr:MAG: translation initiation factor IF-2 [Candidatus Terraquivivens tikiterensis]
MRLRQPIVVVLGHVDHGKTSLLDKMRGTLVAAREAGGITQHIGASLFPLDAIVSTCKALLGEVKVQLKVPGLLFVDTPGHAAFANLRRRGGSIADLAILVVDITKGIQEQTLESIGLLRARRTPFVVAANKIDLIPGWKSVEYEPFPKAFQRQSQAVREELERRVYGIVGELAGLGFRADVYTRITSFATTLAIVPVSAKSGEGIPDLLLVLLGLAQAFMKEQLTVQEEAPAEGVVLEITEEEGLGTTVNAIIYDGTLKVGDRIALLGPEGAFTTKVKAILMPKPLDEMRDPRDRFKPVERVVAAAGLKLVAEGLDRAYPGSPIYAIGQDEEEVLERITKEVGEFKLSTDKVGVVLKADTLGSLEAAVNFLHERGVQIRVADIGELSKRDIVEAEVVRTKDELSGVILAFNVRVDPSLEREANSRGIRVFKSNVLFRLVEDYLAWVREEKERRETAQFESLVKPGKIRILPGYVFRRSNPAIVGVEVLGGRIRPKYTLMNAEGKSVGSISQIQDRGQSIPEATRGMSVAISMKEPIVGRHVREGEVLYTAIPENDARLLLKSFSNRLTEDERAVLEEVVQIVRKNNPLWAR